MGHGGLLPLGPSEEPRGRRVEISPLEDGEVGLGHLSTDSYFHWLKVVPGHIHTCADTHTHTHTHTHILYLVALEFTRANSLGAGEKKKERERGQCWLPTRSHVQLQADSDG